MVNNDVKTTIALAAINGHHKEKEFMNNIVMCPAHLVGMWKREIEARSPRSKAIIIKDFEHLLTTIPQLLEERPKRYKHIWLILSKEIAKFGYELRPAVVWKEHKHAFCCPKCGQPLFYTTYEGRGRNRRAIHNLLTETDFRQESVKKNNLFCENTVRVWDNNTCTYKWVTCNEKLWGPNTKETLYDGKDETRWIKLGKAGWMQHQHLQRVYDRIIVQPSQTAEEATLLAAISDELEGPGYVQKAPRRYPIAKYIREKLKGYIDYFVADELHELKGKDSLQGEAFGDLIYTAKHVLGLTGTLLNGYASGIYYLLFRMFTEQMKYEDYEFKNPAEFTRDYGVTRQSRWYELNNGRLGDAFGASQMKELPGVSPIVFTKFLLKNAAFMSLDDMSDAMPGYREIPVPLEMEEDLRSAYQVLENSVKETLRDSKHGSKLLGQLITLLSVFPDQPYEQPSVIDPETGDILVVPGELTQQYRQKDYALLSLVQRKIAVGEHVLVYYHWTNRTDVVQRLTSLFSDNNIQCAVLDTSVKALDREEWINRQVSNGAQVLLCNPKLVETGLTLLDFTTIVYYQLGYNLYTMRQASRRSWRVNQDHNVEVYFLYYQGTVQEKALSLMASKLQAAMAIEGKFSEEGLNALSNNEDILTQIASSVTDGIKSTIDVQVFEKNKIEHKKEKASVKKEKQPFLPLVLPECKKKKKSADYYNLHIDEDTRRFIKENFGL